MRFFNWATRSSNSRNRDAGGGSDNLEFTPMSEENLPGEGLPSEPEASAALEAERDQLAQEKAELYDRLLRRTAEFDNYRRRTEREMSELREYAASQAVQALLPVLDDFERALQVETADTTYSRGVELIYQRFSEQLKKLGLEPIVAHGQPFDPNVHNAIEMAPTTEHPDQTVMQDLQRGYHFKGRLLRPSTVRVAHNPSAAETAASE
jgi:molecular chaperone GrpE